jgi:hypothetical protein
MCRSNSQTSSLARSRSSRGSESRFIGDIERFDVAIKQSIAPLHRRWGSCHLWSGRQWRTTGAKLSSIRDAVDVARWRSRHIDGCAGHGPRGLVPSGAHWVSRRRRPTASHSPDRTATQPSQPRTRSTSSGRVGCWRYVSMRATVFCGTPAASAGCRFASVPSAATCQPDGLRSALVAPHSGHGSAIANPLSAAATAFVHIDN